MKSKMKFFKNMKAIVLLLSIACLLHSTKEIVFAETLDPGAGRLSGEYVDEGFYDNDSSNREANDSKLNHYGTTNTKSPYNNTTYTHQDRFDGRIIYHGIDVSKWQGPIDWAKVKADGIDYAFIQVGFRGYGSTGVLNDSTKDPYFHVNMQSAIANGIRVGVYVFSQATTEAEAREEAEYILESIGGYNISMPLVLDYEYASTDNGLGGRLYNAKLSKAQATSVCMAFCKEIVDAGYTPMVYANKSMLTDQIDATVLTNAGYRIWLANYNKETTYAGAFDFWQYSEKGKVKGISGNVDMNFYYSQPTDNFAPVATSIASSTFSKVEDQIYTGAAVTPAVTVTRNGVALIPNVDYTINYYNNVEIGVGTIEITGIGAYSHTRRIYFKIAPNSPQNVRAKKRTKSYITLAWDRDASMKGYEIYRSTSLNGNYSLIKKVKKNSTTTFKNTNLKEGKCYYYKIRSYKKINGTTYYSDFSPVCSIYTKTSYVRTAVTKYSTPIYDYLPGTKTETRTTTQVVTVGDENTTNNDAPSTNGSNTNTDNNNNNPTASGDAPIASGDAPVVDDPSEDNPPTENPEDDTNKDNSDNNATDTQTPAPVTQTITVTETVNVDSIPLITLPKNYSFKVIYSTKHNNQTWYYVSYTVDDVTYKGFVKYSKVKLAKQGKIVKTKKVNVRKKSRANSKKLTTLKKNKKVNILSTKISGGAKWYKVQFRKNDKSYTGWISSPYVKVVK